MEKIIEASYVVLNVINNELMDKDSIIQNYKISNLSKPILSIELYFDEIISFMISKGLIECDIENEIKYRATDFGTQIKESLRGTK